MRRVIVVYNTDAGQGEQLEVIKAAFTKHGTKPEYHPIAAKKTTTVIAQAAKRTNTIVVAAGGDGTVNYVAAQLYDGKCSMGIIPVGTLNHFAKAVGVPRDIKQAVVVILTHKPKALDIGTVNGRAFINNASVGFYPRSLLVRKTYSHTLGKWPAAIVGFIHALSRPRRYKVSIVIDGKKQTIRTPFVFIGNNKYKHTPPDIGKRATLTEGILAVYIIKADSTLGILRILMQALFTKKRRTQDFAVYTTASCVIHTHHHRKLAVACDGEVFHVATPLRFRSEPESLRVLI